MENHTSSSTNTNTDPKDPASFLSSIIGVPVTVKLNSGIVYKGELQSVDGYMNIALEKCTEYVNGQMRRNYGDAFVRGNNDVGYIAGSRQLRVGVAASASALWDQYRGDTLTGLTENPTSAYRILQGAHAMRTKPGAI
ncbi:U4/U6-U5 snRNP complex subunit lsm6 [Exophiala xenobiotica]|nr:U4/U6-U5 snRNP complex subunit lsm6 [Exophiala xenobiotica]KAK5192906.1 U4/U6-U5 snRNP complex subunit lsm6 [Exophiala xenobiotica]KAK5212365.1 U4/U6-U5 snRNP complex subunit lsm6 [Exophiala xenobiotica]KAK5219551.1 U4/U6-U5 snRNP complex subunit lsm6 [Exophiala xenobiotica]KAK5219788.1 U4/U6-U5 snRNP complex subunit lsm6 [Exophiala xenobiotica]